MMKKEQYFKRARMYLLAFLGILSIGLNAQESINASGGDASGSGGSVSWSVGQVVYQFYSSTEASAAEGVQQPFEFFGNVLSILEENFSSANAYPNPTQGVFTLTLNRVNLNGISYQLYDISGKLIANEKVLTNQTEIDLTQFAQGVYFLKVFQSSTRTKVFKIIKN